MQKSLAYYINGSFLNNRFELKILFKVVFKCWVECSVQKKHLSYALYFRTRKEYKVIFKQLTLLFLLQGSWHVEGGSRYRREQSGTACDFRKKR